MTAVLLSLLASTLWGTSDFVGGLATRRASVVGVVLIVEGVGLALALALVAATGEPFPGGDAVWFALAAGVSGVAGLGLFYSALSIGTMSIVAPISACGAAIPVVVGLLGGDAISALTAVGLAVTMVGVVLASLEATVAEETHEHTRRSRLSVGLAVLAAIGFGGYFALSDQAADASVPWLLVLARVLVVPALLAVLLLTRTALPAPRERRLLAGAGVFDVGATGLYAVAQTLGALSVVAVVGALYPVTTVLLARGVLGERLRRVQATGVVLALAGVACIAAG